MKRHLPTLHPKVFLGLISLLAMTTACSSDSPKTSATQSDYDDVAQVLGAVVTTRGRGGETGLLYDATQLAVGVAPLGFVGSATGNVTGKHENLDYAYEVACNGVDGGSMPACNLTTDVASVSATCSGNLVTPLLDAGMEHQAELRLTGIQSDAVGVSGQGSFALDAHFSSAWRNVEVDYRLDYTVSYDVVRVRRVPLQIVGGTIHYTVDAERMTSSDDTQSSASFSIDAELTFTADGRATLILDGTHAYGIDTLSGVITKRPEAAQ